MATARGLGEGDGGTSKALEPFVLGFWLDGGVCLLDCRRRVANGGEEEIRLASNLHCDLQLCFHLASGAERLMWSSKSTSGLGVVNDLGSPCRDILAGS